MKLLLDANLSPRLVTQLTKVYPGLRHVREHGLEQADDETIWTFALREGYVIVSKDADFHQRSFLRGCPPKVIWIRVGNCTTDFIAQLLQQYAPNIQRFCDDEEAAFLIVS